MLIRSVVAALALVATVWVGSPVSAIGERQIQVGISPTETGISSFKWTMRPGESRTGSVLLTNLSDYEGYAYTYSGNTATLPNGGLKSESRNKTPSRPTQWTRYADGQLALAPGESLTRTFNVTVPKGTKPGDYSTAIIVENVLPTVGDQVNLRQITRRSAPILVSVPGKRDGSLSIDDRALADPYNVSVGVVNTGNQNLTPSLTMSIREQDGEAIESETDRQLNVFLAGDPTSVELPLSAPLDPGEYLVDVALTAPELTEPVVRNDIPLSIAGDTTKPTLEQEVAGFPIWLILLVLLIVGGVIVFFGVVRMRKNRRQELVASVDKGAQDSGLVIHLKSTTALELSALLGDAVIDFRGSPSTPVTDLVAVLPGSSSAVSVVEEPDVAKAVDVVIATRSVVVVVSEGVIAGVVAAQPQDLPTLIEVRDTHAAALEIARRLAR